MKRIAIISALIIGMSSGCLGTAPFGAQANPETRMTAKYDPFTGTYDVFIYTNDGRAMKVEKLRGTRLADGEMLLEVENLEITERSVENREANVTQIQAQTEMARVFMDGIVQMIPTIARTVVQVKEIDNTNNLDRVNKIGETLNQNPLLQPGAGNAAP